MGDKLTGLIAAPFTPMHPDGKVNLDRIEEIAALLRSEGVSGAFICGTTGEGASLSVAERVQVAERWMAVAGDELAVIVHVGHNSPREARRLAVHAQAAGADGIAALAPSFFKPATIDALVAFCASVASAAPAVPFYYYHIPSMTGVNLSMPEFLRVGGARIPTLAGIKYSTSDLMPFQRCVTLENGRYTMLFGSDEMLLGAMAMGAEGAVGSTYNYAAPNYVSMMSAFEAGDMQTARRHADQAAALVEVLLAHGAMQAGKAIMAMRGVDCGSVRLPLQPLASEQLAALYEDVRTLAIFEDVELTPPAR